MAVEPLLLDSASAKLSARPSPGVEERLIELAARGYRNSLLAALTLAGIVVTVLWPDTAHAGLLTWLAVLALVMGLRWLHARRTPPRDTAGMRRWQRTFVAGAATAGLVWSAAPILLIHDAADPRMIFVACVMAGITTAVSTLHAASFAAAVGFQLAVLLPFALKLVLLGDRLHLGMAAGVALHVATLLAGTRHIHLNLRKSLEDSYLRESLAADIAAQRKVSAELRSQGRYLQTLIDSIPFMVWLKDAEGRFLAANQRVATAAGLASSDMLVGKTDLEVFPGRFAERFFAEDRTVIETGQELSIEGPLELRNGRQAWFDAFKAPVRAENGELLGTVGYARNIAKRRATEERLRELETEAALNRQAAQYKAIFDELGDGLFLLEVLPDGRFRDLDVNPAFERICGISREQLIGKYVEETVPANVAETVLARYRCCVETGAMVEAEDVLDLPIGRRTYHYKVIPLRDADGKIHRLAGITSDVTERKRIEDTLWFIAQRGWDDPGADFLPALARHLGNALGVDYVVIDRLADDPTYAETEALFTRGEILPNMRYALDGTPCDDVINKRLCCHPREVQRLFPDDRMLVDMGVESYAGVPLWDASGKPLGLIAVMDGKPMKDPLAVEQLLQLVAIRAAAELERKRWRAALTASEREFRSLAENAPVSIIRYDRAGRILYVNPPLALHFARPLHEFIGGTSREAWPDGRYAVIEDALHQVLATGRPKTVELAYQEEDGQTTYHLIEIVAERDAGNAIIGALGFGYDLTDLRTAQKSLAEREREFRTLVENSPDMIGRFDCEGRFLYANPPVLRRGRFKLGDIVGKRPSECFAYDVSPFENAVLAVARTGQNSEAEQRWKEYDGNTRTYQYCYVAERESDGEISGVLAIGRDITEVQEYRAKIHALAFFDTLTGLPNRTLFNDRIRHALAEAERHHFQVGLMLLDLDNFKTVNDTLGHAAGDCLLQQAARRLEHCVRASDTVARLGGDEFVVILSNIEDSADLAHIAGNIMQALTDVPYQIDTHEVFTAASIGIALYPDDSGDVETLLKYADSAMYHAKKSGRKNYQFYSAELTARSNARLALESALRRAVQNNELELHYQPQVNLRTGLVIGAEALVRWRRPDGTLMLPNHFIPIAEETGLIDEIGEWVLREAFGAAAAWNARLEVPLKLAVNLSTRQFATGDLARKLRHILADTHCRGEWIELEITESLLLEDSDAIRASLMRLAEMGFSIAIDDFGTGYSALSYLNRFPVSQIKIDRAFVCDIPMDLDKSELVKAFISIAQALHLQLVAEGVETAQQADYLRSQGCDIGQGWLFGKPTPRAEFEAELSIARPVATGHRMLERVK